MYVLNQLGLLCLCQKKKKKSNIVQEFNSPMGSTDMLTISAMCGEKKVFQKFSWRRKEVASLLSLYSKLC